MPVCDGCGAQVNEAHIRSRIAGLEMATRYRPIHVLVLLLDAAPPARIEDHFYRPAGDRAERSTASGDYFDRLIRCSGTSTAKFSAEADALTEFQRRGLFLTYVVECSADSDLTIALGRCAPSLLKRLQFSYKPKYVLPISQSLEGLIPLLAEGGWADRLILNNGTPFDAWSGNGPRGEADMASAVCEKLAKTKSNIT